MTLLDEAKKISLLRKHQTKKIDNEELEVLFAYIKGEIAIGQVSKVMRKVCGASIYSFIAQGFKEAYNQGLIEIKEVKGNSLESK